jgi:hypothetical protein
MNLASDRDAAGIERRARDAHLCGGGHPAARGEQAMKIVLTFDSAILSKHAADVIMMMVELGATVEREDGLKITAEDFEQEVAVAAAAREEAIRKRRDGRGRAPHRRAGQSGAGKII